MIRHRITVIAARMTVGVFTVLIAAAGFSAVADEGAPAQKTIEEIAAERGIRDRLNISLGVYLPRFQAQIQASSTIGVGTVVDFADLLGLDPSETVARLDGYWRFTPKHRLDVSFYDISRKGTQVIDEEIEYQGEVFPVDSTVTTDFSTTITTLDYRYALANTGRIEGGIAAGLSVLDLSSKLDAVDNVTGELISGDVSQAIPLVVVGIYASHTLAKRVFFDYSLLFFSGGYDKYDGTLYDFRFTLEGYPFKHVGFGLGWNSYRIDVKVTDPGGLVGQLDYQNRGLEFYTMFTW